MQKKPAAKKAVAKGKTPDYDAEIKKLEKLEAIEPDTTKTIGIPLPPPAKLAGVVSANEVMDTSYKSIWIGEFAEFFGPVSEDFALGVHGQPGSGKTYFLLCFANYLAENHGPVLFCTPEEFGKGTFKKKIEETGAHSRNLYFAGSLTQVDLKQFQFLFIDSITKLQMTMEEYADLRSKNPHLATVLILQKTKGGNFKGAKDWEHEVDIFADFGKEVTPDGITRTLNVTKNRFGVEGPFEL